ncbi:MAG TPA: outer membrane protein assembly factor BamA [Acidobacteriota bacterium]|nr:outer membrane protein assembly factor BamA [Acidobacteriota bacterium]
MRSVSITGNDVYDQARLQRLMLTVPSGFLRRVRFFPEILADDCANLIAFYQDNGYLEARIADTTVTIDSLDRSVSVQIALNEGERTFVDTIGLSGNTIFTADELLSSVGLSPGEPYRRSALQRGMLNIVARYGARGYVDAAVKPDVTLDSLNHRVSVALRVTEGKPATIRDIRTEGLSHTRSHVVMRELAFARGDTARPARLLESQRRLYRTNLFKSVFLRLQPAPDSTATERDVLIECTEAETGAFNAAIGYGSVERVSGRVEIATRNLMGTARQIGLSLAASRISRSIEGSFTEPWTFGTRWRTDLSALYGFLDEPGYEAERWMVRSVLGRQIGRNTNIALALRTENAILRNVMTDETPKDVGSNTRSLTASLRYDTRDNFFAPAHGFYGEWINEVAGALLGGTNSFTRTVIRGKGFVSVARATVLGSSVELGWIGFLGGADSIPLNERFYAGGPLSLRGFDYQSVGPLSESDAPLGGRYKLVWTVLEIRQVIYKMFGAAAFFDLGNVWSHADAISLSDLRTAAGIGLRAGTPIGIVRIDFAVNLDPRGDEPPNRWHIAAGHAF